MSPVTSPPPKKKTPTHPSSTLWSFPKFLEEIRNPRWFRISPISRHNSESLFSKKNRQYPTISSKYFLKPLWIVSWKTESNGSLIKSILKSKVTALQLNTPMFTHQKFQPFRGEKKIQPSNPILHATMDLKIQWTEYSAKTIWKGQP